MSLLFLMRPYPEPRLLELSLGLERPGPSLGVRELSFWVEDNPELVGEGLRQIEGVR